MVIWWYLIGLPFGFFDWRTTVYDEIVFFIFDVVVWFLSLFHFLLILFVSVAGCQLLRPYEITSSVSTLATSLRLTNCLISSHPFLIWFFFSTVFVKVNRTIEPSSCQIHGVFFLSSSRNELGVLLFGERHLWCSGYWFSSPNKNFIFFFFLRKTGAEFDLGTGSTFAYIKTQKIFWYFGWREFFFFGFVFP